MFGSSAQVADKVEIIRSYYRLVDSGRVESAVALFAEEACYERPGTAPIRGRSALLRFLRGADSWTTEHRLLTAIVADDQVAVRGRVVGRTPQAENVDLGFAEFWTVTDVGEILRRVSYFFIPPGPFDPAKGETESAG